jgi:hypothetical protein
MDGIRDICSITNGNKCLKTYLIPPTVNIAFEVKDHDGILCHGESFKEAATLWDGLCRQQGGR